MKQTYHTIVIGAGIAGLHAARFLKEPALVIDKKPRIGLPVRCGEGISTAALLRENIAIDPSWVQTYITHIKRVMPNGKHIGSRQDAPYALMLDRTAFETRLAGLVKWQIHLGSRVVRITRSGDLWRVDTDTNDTCYAKHLLGADGPASMVAKSVFNISHTLAPGINFLSEFGKEIPEKALCMYFGKNIADHGYGWVFPTSANTANVGLTRKPGGAGTGVHLKRAFDAFINRVVIPKYGPCRLLKNKSGAIPVDGFKSDVPRENAYLAGDAGGFADPIFKGGMNMALYTGRLAAESINLNDPAVFKKAIAGLPFSRSDLLKARDLFYGLTDDTLNALADVIDGRSTAFLKTPQGQAAFSRSPLLMANRDAVFTVAEVWEKAKPYLW